MKTTKRPKRKGPKRARARAQERPRPRPRPKSAQAKALDELVAGANEHTESERLAKWGIARVDAGGEFKPRFRVLRLVCYRCTLEALFVFNGRPYCGGHLPPKARLGARLA